MSMPGFTGEFSVGVSRGVYRSGYMALGSAAVLPQLRIGGGFNDFCCCEYIPQGFSWRLGGGWGGAGMVCEYCPRDEGCACGCYDQIPICVCPA